MVYHSAFQVMDRSLRFLLGLSATSKPYSAQRLQRVALSAGSSSYEPPTKEDVSLTALGGVGADVVLAIAMPTAGASVASLALMALFAKSCGLRCPALSHRRRATVAWPVGLQLPASSWTRSVCCACSGEVATPHCENLESLWCIR
mmetsp:Transcript_135545/g.289905  ORF Transcript_135545/g.289905 Transcript_135545/m.289905 type:complete len:146 (-) Transcript_135545:379-816(-)